jgi:hypothetical protein
MSDKKHLYVLWTSDNRITADKMVFMYTVNALAYGWWERVTLIIWGAAATLVGEDEQVQAMVREAIGAGVHVSACKACADQLGVAEMLENLGVEVTYWGKPLTDILQSDEKLLVI